MNYDEPIVRRNGHRLYVRDYGGTEPAIVLMHGFPDNLHLYDGLVPQLNPPRRVVTFDFLGWGRSDKPAGYPYTATNQTGDLNAVMGDLGLDQMILVAHDASGPPAIDWALDNPKRVSALVLLNTYYCRMRRLRPPEAIWLFSTPLVREVARAGSMWFDRFLFRRIYRWQVGRFIQSAEMRARFVPLLYEQFTVSPSTHEAFFCLNRDLQSTLVKRRAKITRLREFARPVRIVFGAADPYLNAGVAKSFHRLFPTSELFLLPSARHYVQIDAAAEVAGLILALPTGDQDFQVRAMSVQRANR
jgi:pimeloyl-ACP methyl ester carboxylesterase